MALDTRQKRQSAIAPASPWRGPMVDATESGTTQGNRQAAAFLYSGILASGAGGQTVVVTGHPVPVEIGAPTVSATVTVAVAGHPVPVAIGAPTVDATVTVAVAGLAVPIAFGTPAVAQIVPVTGLAVPIEFGGVTFTQTGWTPALPSSEVWTVAAASGLIWAPAIGAGGTWT